VFPESPLLDLLRRDFWGTPLKHSGSHGSFRPLAVLSFRFNVLLAGGSVGHGAARGFHVFNTLLHAAATAAFTRWVRVLTPHRRRSMTPWVSGILFAVHPIHTEAVAGIVGNYCSYFITQENSFSSFLPHLCLVASLFLLLFSFFCTTLFRKYLQKTDHGPSNKLYLRSAERVSVFILMPTLTPIN
jgi:hypothetical protein